MSFKASSLSKSHRVTRKVWNTTLLLIYSFKLSDVGYHANYAQLVDSMLPSSLLAVELEGPSQGAEPTDMRDLL